MLSKDDEIIKEKSFSYNNKKYIARLYYHNDKISPYGEIVYVENGQRVPNMKGYAREFLKPYGIEVSTDARIITTYIAIALLIQKLEEIEK